MNTTKKTSSRSFGMPAPRPKVRPYKYLYDENPDLQVIVFDIIDGLPIDEIEPELYQSILPLLREKERALKEWRNQPASRSISAAIDHIVNYRYCNDPKQLQPRSARTLQRGTGKISKTELSISVDLALRGEFNHIDPRMYKPLIKELKTIHQEALNDHDYLLAERAVNASRRVIALNNDNRFAEITSARVYELADKLSEKENDTETLKEAWEKAIHNAEKQRDEDLKEIERENEMELREFDQQYKFEPPPELRKFSPEILQLRAQEKYMVQSGRYVEATDLNREVNRLEAIESEKIKERWIKTLNFKREELIKKQQEKMFVREMNANNAIAKMRRQASREIEQQEKAVKHVESHYEDATIVKNFRKTTKASLTTRNPNLPQLEAVQAQTNAALFRQRAMINTIVYSKTPKSPRTIKTKS
ncbi:hypothetical protein TRFO_03574 [Tritrichomonas foetus]|uniref:Uncharacterized protein n=1 Tax=Tritrichomonas foetus TaxID=1144522 RepID=A0A1J4KN77_9EUKA|nr:hypothetical protein TRFO_03574 [Tritrichomonas foetus]|eukprot:OHT12570.1 hypothetical protein TRFO_03574 [Tritrichomonas foetus]